MDTGNKLAGQREYPPLRRRGHSKNGRTDAPQIVVGLAVTREGLPVRSWVWPGQTNDVTTIEKVKADLRGWRLGRCVFVGDAGMNSEENRRTLALGGGKYILASKMRAGDAPPSTRACWPRGTDDASGVAGAATISFAGGLIREDACARRALLAIRRFLRDRSGAGVARDAARSAALARQQRT